MKLPIITFAVFAALVAGESYLVESRSETISIQSIDTNPSPIIPLAEIRYDPSTLEAEFSSYDAPEISSQSKLVRIGIYDPTTKSWQTSTSVTSANSFNKGYAQTIILSLNVHGDVLGVSCKSAKIDAGQTRNFGPKVKAVRMVKGKTPELNRPIIASKDGTVEGEEPEKSFFQRWVHRSVLILIYLLVSQILVGSCSRNVVIVSYWRWRQIDTRH